MNTQTKEQQAEDPAKFVPVKLTYGVAGLMPTVAPDAALMAACRRIGVDVEKVTVLKAPTGWVDITPPEDLLAGGA